MSRNPSRRRFHFTMTVLFGTAAAVAAVPAHADEKSGDDALLGRWQGVLVEREGAYHAESAFELEFARGDDGELGGRYIGRTARDVAPFREFTFDGTRLTALLGPLDVKVAGTLNDDGTLDITFTSREGTNDVVLRRTHPDFAKFRNARLAADGSPVTTYEYHPPQQTGDGWAVSTLADEHIDASQVAAFMSAILKDEYHLVDSVLVARNGKLVLEEYFYGRAQDCAHVISSCTKSLSSMIVGAANRAGLVPNLDVMVAGLFEDYAGKKWIDQKYPITLRHVLSMTSGLKWDEESAPYTDPSNMAGQMVLSDDWTGFVLDRELADTPGEKYVYNSGTSGMLGAILQRITHKPIEQLAEELLFGPLGITNYKWAHQPNGAARSAGAFEMTPRDMLKLGQVMLDGGRWNGREVLTEEWVRESTSQQTRPGDYAYGYLWHLLPKAGGGAIESSVDAFFAAGEGGQIIYVVPEYRLAVVATSGNFVSKPPHVMLGVLKYILPAVQGE